MFNVIEKEMQWRRSQGLPEGFGMLKKRKPVVAAGAEGPLDGRVLMADYYRTTVHTRSRKELAKAT